MTPVLRLLRPNQWLKNAFVLAPLFFAQLFTSYDAWVLALSAALAFCLTASAVYILNDWLDRKQDRLHPIKAKRPLAAREISGLMALAVGVFCLAGSATILRTLPSTCALLVAAYVVANIAYSYRLKHVALLDVFFIASCFVLRVLVGCYALSVMVSPWIILTTFMLALFLGFGKRYHELGVAGYALSKPNLQYYSRELLDKLILVTGAAALVCYAIYTAEIATATHPWMVYTVAFVAFGLFRYLQSIYVFGQGGEPEDVLTHDRWQLVNALLWFVVTLLILGGIENRI